MTALDDRPATSAPAADFTTPDADEVLHADAPREQWLQARRLGIGGSDASTVADLNPYNSRYSLYLDKLGEAAEREVTPAMEWGVRLEPVLRDYAAEKLGVPFVRRGLLRSKAHPWMLFTPDGIGGDGSNLECKTTSWRSEDADIWRVGDVPDHAEMQAQHGMAVTGRRRCWVVGLIDGREPFIVPVDADPALQDLIVDMTRRFWHDNVLTRTPPPLDGSGATTAAIRDRYQQTDHTTVLGLPDTLELLKRRKDALTRAAAAEVEAEEITNRLKDHAGPAEVVAVDGEPAYTWKQTGRLQEALLAADDPDLHARYVRAAPVFDLATFKTEQPSAYQRYRGRRFHVPKRTGTPPGAF